MSKKMNKIIFNDKSLKKDVKDLEKCTTTFGWLVEFSKKVIFATFIIYLISTIVEIILLFIYCKNGDTTGFETFITESNTTFKVVVAGYCIKAAIENVIKIGGTKNEKLLKIKYILEQDKLSKETGINFKEENNDNNEEESEEVSEEINEQEDISG